MADSWWRKPDPRSEFEGRGVQDNTVFPVDTDAITASDALRLDSLTGQTIDSRAPRDPYHWNGGQVTPDDEVPPNLPSETPVLDAYDPY